MSRLERGAIQASREAQVIEAYLALDMALVGDNLSEPPVKAGVQAFILGMVDILRQAQSLNWDQFIATYEVVLANHQLLPTISVAEFVDKVGELAASDSDVEGVMRQGAQSIAMYVSERDANAPMDLLGVPSFAKKRASSFAALCARSNDKPMCDSMEIECARLAWDSKLELNKRRLGEIYTHGFESPLSGVSLWPEGRSSATGLLLLPVAWLLILILAIVVPFAYILHRIQMHKAASALRQKIREPFNASVYEPPACKTLEALWESCGLPGGLGLDESSALLSNWLVVLYGQDVARSVGAEARVREIAEEQVEANRPYYEGGEDATHFHFGLPIESLIRELAEQLPPYDSAEEATALMMDDNATWDSEGGRLRQDQGVLVSVLDHLVYIIECLASEITGEAKSELRRLIDAVEQSELQQKRLVLDELNESANLLKEMQYRYASTPLARARRLLWKGLMK